MEEEGFESDGVTPAEEHGRLRMKLEVLNMSLLYLESQHQALTVAFNGVNKKNAQLVTKIKSQVEMVAQQQQTAIANDEQRASRGRGQRVAVAITLLEGPVFAI